VPEIEVGLGTVVGDVHLSMLIRTHRSRINVYVRIEFLQGDAVAVPFEQSAD
jgi:hypothetical protein